MKMKDENACPRTLRNISMQYAILLIILFAVFILGLCTRPIVSFRLYFGEKHLHGAAYLFYYDSFSGLSEDKSVDTVLNGGSLAEFHLLASNYSDKQLRMDPVNIQEDFSIQRVEVICRGEVFYDLTGKEFIDKVEAVDNCDWEIEEDTVYFYCHSADPSITLSQTFSSGLDVQEIPLYYLAAILCLAFGMMRFTVTGMFKKGQRFGWEKILWGILFSLFGSRYFLEYMRLPFYGLIWIIFACILFCLFIHSKPEQDVPKRNWLILYAVIFSVGMIAGYHIKSNFNLYFGTKWDNYIIEYSLKDIWVFFILLLVVMSIFHALPGIFKVWMSKIQLTDRTGISDNKKWILVACILFLLWIPYLLTYYPGFILGDSISSIHQALGNINWDNHHPLWYTFFINICLHMGIFMKDVTFGCCIYTLIQMAYIALCLGYFICWLWNKGMPIKAGWVMTAVYGLSPFFACNSIAMWKDPIFSATICVWTLTIFDFVLSEGAVFNKKFLIKNLWMILIICFIRNNGIYMVCFMEFSLLLTMFVKRKDRFFAKLRKVAICMGAMIIVVYAITGPLYQKLNLSGEPVESLGIFLNQMASVASYNGNMSDADREFMAHLLPLERYEDAYKPCVVDRLKWDSEFNQDYLNTHMADFWKTYFSMLVKNPGRYIKAWELNTFGYWAVNYWEFNFDHMNVANGNLGDIKSPLGTSTGVVTTNLLDHVIKDSKKVFPYNDAWIALAIISWLVLFCYIAVFIKERFYMNLALAPSAGLLLTLLVGTPYAFWQRYGLAMQYLLPFYIFMLVSLKKMEKSK